MKCPQCNFLLSEAESASGVCPRCKGTKLASSTSASSGSVTGSAMVRVEAVLAEAQAKGFVQSHSSSPAKKRPRWIVLAIAPLLVAGLAWLLAGHWIWSVASILMGVLAAGWLLGVFRSILSGHRPSFRRDSLMVMGYLGLIGAIWLGVGYWFQVGKVHVDNYCGQTLNVFVDGQPWLTVGSETTKLVNLSPGRHTISVQDEDSRQLDELQVHVDRQGVYVLNLLGSQTYYRGSQDYGGFGFDGTNNEKAITDCWFEPKVDYLFTRPPESIVVNRKRGEPVYGDTKYYLRRGSKWE